MPEGLNGSYSGTEAYLLGIRVQVVLPGATRTAIWEKAGKDIASLHL